MKESNKDASPVINMDRVTMNASRATIQAMVNSNNTQPVERERKERKKAMFCDDDDDNTENSSATAFGTR